MRASGQLTGLSAAKSAEKERRRNLNVLGGSLTRRTSRPATRKPPAMPALNRKAALLVASIGRMSRPRNGGPGHPPTRYGLGQVRENWPRPRPFSPAAKPRIRHRINHRTSTSAAVRSPGLPPPDRSPGPWRQGLPALCRVRVRPCWGYSRARSRAGVHDLDKDQLNGRGHGGERPHDAEQQPPRITATLVTRGASTVRRSTRGFATSGLEAVQEVCWCQHRQIHVHQLS